jgi:hypothetical protein
MESESQLIAAENARIQRKSLEAQALMHPEGADIFDLLASGIAPATVAALYPLDIPTLAAGLDERLRREGEAVMSTFIELFERTNSDTFMNMLYDRMPSTAYFHLSEERLPFVEDSRMLLQVAAGYLGNEPLYAALLGIGGVMWLAAHWGEIEEVHGFGKQLLIRLDALPQILPAREAVSQS